MQNSQEKHLCQSLFPNKITGYRLVPLYQKKSLAQKNLSKKLWIFRNFLEHQFKEGITKPCTHLHPVPSSSTQLHPAPPRSTHLHLAHFNLHPALCNTSTLLKPKYCTWLGNFPKFRPKNPKLFILTENWQTLYLEGADSKSGLTFLEFRPQNPFVSKFGPKKSKLFFLPEIGPYGISRMLILIPTLVFSISNLKSIFGQISAKKSQKCLVCLKIGIQSISRILVLIATLVFWISKPKSIFGQIWVEKPKFSILTNIYWGSWFLFWHNCNICDNCN